MNNEKFLKITYHGGDAKKTKLNAYLKMPSPTYAFLLREIQICIFDQHKQTATELRTYWIDEDGDEIEIVNQCDYEIFTSKRSERRHLQVAPINPVASAPDSDATKESNNDSNANPQAFNVHERVECDGCGTAPIVGFRYKCIQCPNYDLCERCESQHKHAEHMMVRMPNDNCPNVVEAWVSGRGSRRHHKRSATAAGSCPFFMGGTATPPRAADGSPAACKTSGGKSSSDGGKEHHLHGRHARKEKRRQMQHGIFTHLYNMMQDLAEGGGPSMDEETENTTKATNVAAAAHEAAHAAALKAAAAAASATTAAATAAAAQMAFVAPAATAPEPPRSTGATPKTPPPTPNNNGNVNTEEPIFEKCNQATSAHTPTSPKSNENAATPKSNEDKNTAAPPSPQTTPVLNSPIFENVAQFVDPQYMKAGIQILNNFSEMFAKMLDPVDGAGNNSMQCPFQAAGFPPQQRKSSASSMASNISTATSASTNSDKASETTSLNNTADSVSLNNTADSVVTLDVEIETETSTEAAAANSMPDSTGKTTESRSESEETDWQIIDKQPMIETPTENLVKISPSSSTDAAEDQSAINAAPAEATATVDTASAGAAALEATTEAPATAAATDKAPATAAASDKAPATAAVATDEAPKKSRFDFAKLNRDLEAHMLKQKAQREGVAASIATPEEKREIPIYHQDQRINNAVHAMMAMGFSNEGAWLTQLLESVNGSIPQALDLMSVAHN